MLVAAGLLAVSASVLLFSYLTKRRIPDVVISAESAESTERTQEHNDETGPESVRKDFKSTVSPTRVKSVSSPALSGGIPEQKYAYRSEFEPPPPLINGALKKTTAELSMPPPPRPIPRIPKPSATLRPPPSQASTLRAPTTQTHQPSSTLAPSTSTLPPSSRPSKKVLLEPGHSPLDWAHLTRYPPTRSFLRGSDVPPNLIRVKPSLLKAHNGRKGSNAWGVFGGRVYNITPYLDFHPGGRPELMRAAGNESGQKLFMEAHPWVSWENMLSECCVGILVGENEDSKNEMENMD